MGDQISGEIFTPCFMSEEEYKEGYRNSAFWVEGDYLDEYRSHIIAMSHIASMAKIFILENWKKITDWSGLHVKITHGPTGEVTEYYNYVPHISGQEGSTKSWDRILEEMNKDNEKKHNPITEVNSIVLDPTDGDFSITVNGGKEHWWINDEEIIIIADYIEHKIKSEKII